MGNLKGTNRSASRGRLVTIINTTNEAHREQYQ